MWFKSIGLCCSHCGFVFQSTLEDLLTVKCSKCNNDLFYQVSLSDLEVISVEPRNGRHYRLHFDKEHVRGFSNAPCRNKRI